MSDIVPHIIHSTAAQCGPTTASLVTSRQKLCVRITFFHNCILNDRAFVELIINVLFNKNANTMQIANVRIPCTVLTLRLEQCTNIGQIIACLHTYINGRALKCFFREIIFIRISTSLACSLIFQYRKIVLSRVCFVALASMHIPSKN